MRQGGRNRWLHFPSLALSRSGSMGLISGSIIIEPPLKVHPNLNNYHKVARKNKNNHHFEIP